MFKPLYLNKALNPEGEADGFSTCEDSQGSWMAKDLLILISTVLLQKEEHLSVSMYTAKSADARSHLHASSFSLWILQAHLYIFCGCFLHTYEPQRIKKSRQMVNALGGRGVNPVSPTPSV